MGEAGASVEEIILEKLRNDKVPDQVANLVIQAMRGGEEPGQPAAAPSPDGAPRLTYLKAITVEGFRGIGPAITLPLQPGAGLTLVTGRNGSGKSSFAEAAELALTGDSKRWADRTAGLALFLPRATATESPFGFLVIDDPVQSMDPAKVDGLARVLSHVGRTRHQLPEQVRAVAVAGLCRGALEAACFEIVRCRQLGAGVPPCGRGAGAGIGAHPVAAGHAR